VIVVGLSRAFNTWNIRAVIDLVHVGVDSGAPGCSPEFLLAGIKGVPEDVGIGGVVDLEFNTNVGEGVAGTSDDSERRMVASTATRNDQFIGGLGTFGCSSHFTVGNSEASGFKVS